MMLDQSLRESTFVLFARTIYLDDPGEHTIDLVQWQKVAGAVPPKIVASVTVKVAGDPALPWMKWGASEQAEVAETASQSASGIVFASVSNPAGGIAVPKPPNQPSFFQAAPNGATPLPQLIPDQPDTHTQLQMADNVLIFTGPKINWLFPQNYFLTRWWINDQPYVPSPTDAEVSAQAYSGAVPYKDPSSVRFNLDFHPERMGVKKGDKVGVQVLNCPNGCLSSGNLAQAMMADAIADSPPPPPISPRPPTGWISSTPATRKIPSSRKVHGRKAAQKDFRVDRLFRISRATAFSTFCARMAA